MFVVIIAAGEAEASMRESSSRLASSLSIIASHTHWDLATADSNSGNPTGSTDAYAAGVMNAARVPARAFSMLSSTRSRVTSTSETPNPRLARWAAIPVPIVPAPTTQTWVICELAAVAGWLLGSVVSSLNSEVV